MRALIMIVGLMSGTIGFGQTTFQISEIIDSKTEIREYPQNFEVTFLNQHIQLGDANFSIMYEVDLKEMGTSVVKGKRYKLFQTRNQNNYSLEIEHENYEILLTLYEYDGDTLIRETKMKSVSI
jgi:hypothetical protein